MLVTQRPVHGGPCMDTNFIFIAALTREISKISEDIRGRSDDVFITKQHILVQFKLLCNHGNGDLFNILTRER